MTKKKEKQQTYRWLWLIASVAVCFFASNACPLIDVTIGDSSIFMTAGQSVLGGKLLYADIFDNKGPVIFLIDAAAQWLGIGLLGVWLFEIAFTFVSLLAIWRAVRLLCGNKTSLFVMLCYISYIIWLFEGGNNTEIFSLPFSSWALYFAARVFTDENAGVKPVYGFWLGVGFAMLVLMRATNAVIIVGVTAMLVLLLLIEKSFKTLFLNMAAFIGGVAVISVPLCIYFALNGAFYDFMYGTFLFNLLYSGNGTWERIFANKKFVLWLCMCVFLGVAGGVCHLFGKGKSLRERIFGGGMVCVTVLAALAECMAKRAFQHYLLIGAPIFALGLAMVCRRFVPYLSGKRWSRAAAAVLTAVVFVCGCRQALGLYSELLAYKPTHDAAKAQIVALSAEIPLEDRDSVWAYNVDASWYVYSRINPCFRNFALQDWMSVSDPEITDNILTMLDENPPKWIVALNRDVFGKPEVMRKITEKYEIASQNETERLYRRK